ncbi:YybH family protein [Gemmatimonas sp.]|jgi:ketosteroid isomerase-like protein|uniref:YybH family protein n=1 Tax=Gemmatimonas sp. TaxID=1962908 RepID=UPI0022C2E6F6|nr:nuclear transport factor 2 family protein [Gemmatimonas sp.]MCZ8013860.1 nuclear transport factor 2 family protein [Gemmatimonas sp.]MCZ8268108.1 nuclear transport factor 2 family protein [Gemmatimonas sp.]
MINTTAIATAALVLSALAPSGAQAQAANRTVDQASAVIRAVFASAERADMAALDTLYAGDSLTVFESAGMNRGWKDYRDHHLAPELKEMTGFKYRPIEIVTRVQGNMAWATVSYALQAKEGARTIDNFGRGTFILERSGTGEKGRWVVRHSHTASRARRPTDPPMPN